VPPEIMTVEMFKSVMAVRDDASIWILLMLNLLLPWLKFIFIGISGW
jgi:hypothetical protein